MWRARLRLSFSFCVRALVRAMRIIIAEISLYWGTLALHWGSLARSWYAVDLARHYLRLRWLRMMSEQESEWVTVETKRAPRPPPAESLEEGTDLICSVCRSKYIIKQSEREHFENKGWSMPKKCKACRQLVRKENIKENARRKSKGWGFR
eukprot:1181826-Prorocentrum_minimum.AAC.5